MVRSVVTSNRLLTFGVLIAILLAIACSKAAEETAAPAPAAAPAPTASSAAAPKPAAPVAAPAPSGAPAAPVAAAAPAAPSVVPSRAAAPTTVVERPPFAGPNALATAFAFRADRPHPSAEQAKEKGAQFMMQYSLDKLPIWTKAFYGGQAVFSSPGVSVAHLDPFKYVQGARSSFGGTFMTFDNGRCTFQGKSDMSTCDGTRAEIYITILMPGVFERWEQPTPRSYIFHVNKKAVWPAIPPMNRTDRAVTAEDVVWYMETMKKGGIMAATFSLTDTIEAVDRYTVKVTMKEVHSDFIRGLGTASMAIIPKECYDEKGCREKKFISPGPFTLKTWEPRSPALFEKNREFHIKGVPWLDSIRTLPLADAASQQAAFITGKIDFYRAYRPSEMESVVRNRPGAQVLAAISTNGLLHYRVKLQGAMADQRVRRALAKGVDWPLAWEAFNDGFAIVGTEISYEHLGLTMPPAIAEAEYYQTDVPLAKRLLAEAGYPNGFEITIQTSSISGWSEISLAMQDQWKRSLGVNAKIKLVPSGSHTQSLYDGTWNDLWYSVCYGASCAYPDAEGAVLQHVSYSPLNFSKVNDAFVDQLYVLIRGEIDPVKRKELLWRYQRYAWETVYTFSMGDPLGFEVMQPWELNATFHSQLWLGGVNGSMWTHMFDLSKFPTR